LLYQLWWRKKKVDFIIPPTYFRNNSYSITEVVSLKTTVANAAENAISETTAKIEVEEPKSETLKEPETLIETSVESSKSEIDVKPESVSASSVEVPKLETDFKPETGKISALSLGSIRAKKEMMEAQKGVVKVEEHLPSEAFTETEMLELWYKFADRLGDKGAKIMESLLRISDPKLDGTIIIYELPNEGSKIDFEKAKPELLGYLRGHLHNHDITIEVVVNEAVKVKNAFTPQDKYNRLNEINPNLELLKKTFDLDL